MTTHKGSRFALTLVLLGAVLSALCSRSLGQTPDKVDYVAVGANVTHGTADQTGTFPAFFAEGQKEYSKFRLKARFDLSPRPVIGLFQSQELRQRSTEIRLHQQVEFSPFTFGSIRPFVGAGVEYFHQFYPDEPGGTESHFHDGLNPTGAIGVQYSRGNTRHTLTATRIFQELKARKYKFYSLYPEYEEDGELEFYRRDEQHKGTLNPSYIDGWRLDYSGLTRRKLGPFKGIIYGGRVEQLKYRECPIKGGGRLGEAYCDSYYETDVNISARFGFWF